jgi:hypothetical protein
MIDTKTAFRATLIADTALIALVPADRIKQAWPTSFATLPLIAFSEIDNGLDEMDYADDASISETSIMQVDMFFAPNTSSTAVAQAVDRVLSADFWNRDYSGDFVEPDSRLIHRVARYSKRVVL